MRKRSIEGDLSFLNDDNRTINNTDSMQGVKKKARFLIRNK